MKTIIKIFAGLVSVVLLSGCTAYQHVRLESEMPRSDNSGFLIENDSLTIKYSFYGENGPIHLEFLNKLDKPLFIDWGKSALITNGQSSSLWKDESSITANSTTYKIIPESEIISSTSSIEGRITKKDKVTFVPPHSMISVNSLVLQTKFFDSPNQSSERKTLYTNQGKTSAKKFTFSKENSPLSFRIFLSVSDEENFNNPIQYDNTFWVSDYFLTSVSPESLGIFPGNQFYLSKTTAVGRTVGIVSLVGILTVLSILTSDGAGN